jgi:hypothetical protein
MQERFYYDEICVLCVVMLHAFPYHYDRDGRALLQ